MALEATTKADVEPNSYRCKSQKRKPVLIFCCIAEMPLLL
jgi:hypothetical protein